MKMNTTMATHWPHLSTLVQGGALCNALAQLAAGPVVNVHGALVLRALLSDGIGKPKADDLTGFEALTNKVHISDYVDSALDGDQLLAQGFMFASQLSRQLASAGGPFRIVLSRDPEDGDVTVRFFLRRAAEPWGAEDPDEYKAEEVAQWDVPSHDRRT